MNNNYIVPVLSTYYFYCNVDIFLHSFICMEFLYVCDVIVGICQPNPPPV